MYTIYCHTSPSGKKYIGQTVQTMHRRWLAHVESARSKGRVPGAVALNAAILRYGAETFTHEVLEEVETIEEANAAEASWIVRLGTLSPNGYNLKSGGGGGGAHAQETKIVIGEKSKAARARMTPEQKAEHARRTGEGGRATWASLTPEERSERVRKAQAGISREARIAGLKKWTPEARAAQGASIKASIVPGQRSEAARRFQASRTPEQRSEAARKANETRRRMASDREAQS